MTLTAVAERRTDAVAAAMADIRDLDAGGVDRDAVNGIRDRLIELAAQRDLFPAEEFPASTSGNRSTLYRLSQDEDERFALYLQVVGEGTQAPPHEHTTWAVIVGFEGQELNRLYAGPAEGAAPEVAGEFVVQAGTGIAFLAEDVHSIHIEGRAMNFHCYGRALESLDRRRYWSSTGEWKVFPAAANIVDARG